MRVTKLLCKVERSEEKKKRKKKVRKMRKKVSKQKPNECEGNHKRAGLTGCVTKRRTGTCKKLGRRLSIMGIDRNRAEPYSHKTVNLSWALPCGSLLGTLQVDQVLCPITVLT